MVVSLLRDRAGSTIGFVIVAQDISERQWSELESVRLNEQLVESSRKAGMAEVARSVLHNVGNVLNSVNISSSMIAERVRNSKSGNLSRAVGLMQAHSADLSGFFSDNPKGKQLLPYLLQLAEHFESEQQFIVTETRALLRSMDHTKEIVAAHQNYTRIAGPPKLSPFRSLSTMPSESML